MSSANVDKINSAENISHQKKKDVTIHILSPLSVQTSKYNYFKYLMTQSSCWQKVHYVIFIIISGLIIAAASLSLIVQLRPLHFVPGVKVIPPEIPWPEIYSGIGFISLYIFVLPGFRYYINGHKIKGSILLPYEWRSKRPNHRFLILNKVNILHPIQFISQFIRVYKVNNNISFHPSKLIHICSWIFGFITIVAFGIVMHIIFRTIISGSIFIIAYSSYFSNVITIAIPFAYYFYVLNHYYFKQHRKLCFSIVKTLPEVDKHLDEIFKAPEGEIEIYFRINENDSTGKRL